MQYTITAFSENTPGVLYRIADLFLRRKINIESLTVSETEREGYSRFTIVVQRDLETVQKVVKQLYRIVEVTKVYESEDKELVHKEIAFIKVFSKKPEKRKEIEDLALLLRAKIVHVGPDYLIIEKSGSEESIDALRLLLKPYGLREFVRSGRIAMLKGEQDQQKTVFGTRSMSNVTTSLDVSAIKKIELMARSKNDVISLAQGIPHFSTPEHIRQAAKKAIDNGLVDKYTSGYGIQPLREAIVEKLAKVNGIKAEVDNVLVTHGGIEAVMAVFLSIMNPSDELIMLTPDYASHITQSIIARNGGRPIYVPLDESANWKLDVGRLEGAITQKTKAILVCNPSNPIGKVYTEHELKEIVRIATKYNLFIISDEMYEFFTFDGKKHISIAKFPEAAERTISVFGLSKSYAMTGWRIGYISASKEVIKQIFKVHDSLVTCATAVSQYAAIAAIQGSQKPVADFVAGFDAHREIVMQKLQKTDKLMLYKPEGAYYAFPKLTVPVDDYEFAVRAVNEAGVAVVPGSAFGLGGEGHIRISYGCTENQLREGLDRLITFLNTSF